MFKLLQIIRSCLLCFYICQILLARRLFVIDIFWYLFQIKFECRKRVSLWAILKSERYAILSLDCYNIVQVIRVWWNEFDDYLVHNYRRRDT